LKIETHGILFQIKPETSPEGVEMNIRYHMILTVCITAVFVCLSIGSKAIGQAYAPGGPPLGYYYQPPSMAPTGPSMYPGVFYIGGGAKVRDLQTLSIGTKNAELTNIIVPGSPAFGQQNVGGPVLYPPTPTGTSGTAPDTSGIWAYDDGYIEPTGGGSATAVLYPSGASPSLGHASGGADVGSFQIFDFRVQANDAGSGSMLNTTSLTWSKMLTGLAPTTTNGLNVFLGAEPAPGTPYYTEQPSGGFAVSTDAGAVTDFQNRVWAPYIEFGFQSTALFDVFYGVSFFQVSRTFTETRQTVAQFARRAYRDTYAFYSSDTAPWTILNFDSTAGTATETYKIYPNDNSGRPIPSRTFFTSVDSTVPLTPAQESITAQLDFTTIESRSGGRAWIPLWGMGRMGTSFGGLAAATTATLTSNALYVATAASPPLLPGGAPLRLAGDVLVNSSGTTKASLWNFGIFCAADLELGFSRIFVKSAIEYNYYFYGTIVESDIIATKVNLSGAAATISAGLRF
jgi:hypothetical protein